jgi:hypothetical protein
MIFPDPRIETRKPLSIKRQCRDFDEDCFGLDHLSCWLYDPTQGLCPFLTDDALTATEPETKK